MQQFRLQGACKQGTHAKIGRFFFYRTLRGAATVAGCSSVADKTFVPVVLFQYFVCPFNNFFGQSCQPGHVHAVAPVRAAPDDAPQEDDIVAPFLNGNGIIFNPFQHIFHGDQFMVMRGKQRFCFNLCLDVFHHRPGDGHAVVGAGTPAHFVQDDQGILRGVF